MVFPSRPGVVSKVTQTASDIRLIDVSDKPVKAKVVREGYQVPIARIDESKASFFLDNLVAVVPKEQPRVVSQSIPPGTRVTRGTVVDLILAPRITIPFDIFDNVHIGLVGKNIPVLDAVLDDPQVRQALLAAENPDDIPEDQKADIRTKFARAGVEIIDDDPERSFARAFDAGRSALAYR
jgi:hypothetical protein